MNKWYTVQIFVPKKAKNGLNFVIFGLNNDNSHFLNLN